jgi:hypothetical protein
MAADDESTPKYKIESPWFNVNKLEPNQQVGRTSGGGTRYFADGSDTLANQGYVIDFEHVPSGKQLFFKAFILAYNETFSPDWSEESAYGRMDPIYQFKQTTRQISMGLKIPAASESEAFENLAKLQALTQFLYPNYYDVNSATTIAQSPILRLGVMNLGRSQNQWYRLHDQGGFDTTAWGEQYRDQKGGGGPAPRGEHNGLLGVLKNLTINYNLDSEAGVIERAGASGTGNDDVSEANTWKRAGGSILPKLIEINFDFAVLHEHPLGWNQEGKFSNTAFPFGIDYEASGPTGRATMLEEEKAALNAGRARDEEARLAAFGHELTEAFTLARANAAEEAALAASRVPEQAEEEEQGRLRNLLGKVGRGARGVGHVVKDIAVVTSPVSFLTEGGRNRQREALSHFGGDEDED